MGNPHKSNGAEEVVHDTHPLSTICSVAQAIRQADVIQVVFSTVLVNLAYRFSISSWMNKLFPMILPLPWRGPGLLSASCECWEPNQKKNVRPTLIHFWFNGQVPEGLGKVLSSIGNAVEVFERIYRCIFVINVMIVMFFTGYQQHITIGS